MLLNNEFDFLDQCPAFECDLVCRNGFQTDADGCEICECNLCPQVRCAIECENGFKTDNDGCLICECNDEGIIPSIIWSIHH